MSGQESKWAAGYTKTAGKIVASDGLVAKSGKRRILPDWEDADDKFDHDYFARKLREIARKTLTGRRRDVFERMVIGPLMGDEKPDARALADKYSVPTKRIYEDLVRAKEQVEKARQKPEPARQSGEQCPTCGRQYDRSWNWSACKRGYGGPSSRFIDQVHPECLPPAEKAKLLAQWTKLGG